MDNSAPARRKKLISFCAICILCSLIAFLLGKFEVVDNLEKRSWDWRIKSLSKDTEADKSIKLILIDQQSLDYFAEHESIFWPWPRSVYSRIIDFLKLAGAKGVAFDIIFSEDSHYSVEEDNQFAESIKGGLPVISATALEKTDSAVDSIRFEKFKNKQLASADRLNTYNLRTIDKYKSATIPIDQILEASQMIGNVSSENDSDGVFRFAYAGSYINQIPVLSLPFALYEASNQAQVTKTLPYNDKQQLVLRFPAPNKSFERYSFAAIYSSINRIDQGMKPQISPSELKDSYVLVGMSAPGLRDLRPTPLNPKAPGVEVHAAALDNLVNDRFIKELPLFYDWGFATFFILLSATVIFFSTSASMQICLALATQLALIASAFIFCFAGYWVHLVMAFITGFIATLLSLAEQYRLEGAQSRFIKKAFKYYVSPEVIEKIISNPGVLKLGGDKRELSIFFCDIQGFTSISESMDPSTLVQFLNKFLSSMTSIILRHGGTVDKYVGDAIVAFWNAPLPVEQHALKAVRASIECQQKLADLRTEFRNEFKVDVFLRIGLHTGSVSVGNFGSAERFNYTVIGDAANLASRLEGANKMFGTDILFSEETNNGLNNSIDTIRLAKIKVVGKDRPIWVYTTNKLFSESELKCWNQFIEYIDSADIQAAKSIINSLPDLKLVRAYKSYLSQHNPLQEWDGILQLSEK